MPTRQSTRPRRLLTQSILKDMFIYDPDDGRLIWRKSRGGRHAKAGMVAGYAHRQGYVMVQIGGHGYLAHRLIWLMMTGSWPTHEIDHRNLIKDDNRWRNLRQAAPHQNCANRRVRSDSKSGVKGVSRKGNKWRAVLTKHGQRRSLGYFDTVEQASAAYRAAAKKINAAYARA